MSYKPFTINKQNIENYSSLSLSDKKTKKYPKDTIIGFKMYGNIYYFDGIWKEFIDINRNNELLKEVENDIVGEIKQASQKNETMQFKIRLKNEKGIKDGRKINTGSACKNKKNIELNQYAEKLNINFNDDKYKTKKKLNTIDKCNIIELKLRQLQREAREKKTNIRWFYENFEL